jgi:ATP-dependent exoDNAse (exonuclease V) alpha subunit
MVLDQVVDNDNRVFELAADFIHHTSRCIFLTGKAGTGKTTFLREIKHSSKKNTVVVAPTGVAAINAGGTTIHSFFQLPFSPFVPARTRGPLFESYGLLQNLRIDTEKRNIFRELELLIIDEVSMVRCDVLDAIDVILRFFRRREDIPFGGVQVLLIGDLYQLPPVVQREEWSLLGQYYQSPFFFDAHVVSEASPLYIELRKIYRQTDPLFIDLLNKIRNNDTTERDIETLNANYKPGFSPEANTGYITLTTHNHKADKINYDALSNLPGEPANFEGEVEGDFPERNYPTDKRLALKVGAQIMFIKNDTERIRRYYNGKIGTVKNIRSGTITVTFPGTEEELEVSKDTWRNVRYTYNAVSNQVEEEVLGTFTQYAIRLAWAITIHKSQGLTFDKVVIDAGNSFAPGQVYVALSRCTSLSGIVLYSRILRQAIRSDDRVIAYSREERTPDQLLPVLIHERQQYKLSALLNVFDWTIATGEVRVFKENVQSRKFIDQEKAQEVFDALESILLEQEEITKKFSLQLRGLLEARDFSQLLARVDAGVEYFCGIVDQKILAGLKEYDAFLAKEKKVKKVRRSLKELISFFYSFKECLLRGKVFAKSFHEEGE